MAGITLPLLRSKVLTRISANAADSYLTSDILDALINEAVQQVVSEADWPWLGTKTSFNGVVGQTDYVLSTILGPTWYRVHSIYDTVTGNLLDIRAVQEMDRLNFPVGATQGNATQYSIFGDILVLGPAPMDTRLLTVRWYQREPLLVGDNDVLIMPNTANWYTGIVEYAAYLALRSVREDTRAESAYTAYTRWIARVRDEKLRWHESIRVRVRPGSMI